MPILSPSISRSFYSLVNRLCGSGFQSIVTGVQEILVGDAEIVLTGTNYQLLCPKNELKEILRLLIIGECELMSTVRSNIIRYKLTRYKLKRKSVVIF